VNIGSYSSSNPGRSWRNLCPALPLIGNPSPSSIYRVIGLPSKRFGVMNVIAAVLAAQGDRTNMKHFTITPENYITVHGSKKAARETGAAVFSTEEQLADLIGPDSKRLVEIWNSIPGARPVTKFANRKVGTERIWKAIQGLGEASAAEPASEPQVATIEPEPVLAEVPVPEPSLEPIQTETPVEDAAPQATAEPTLADQLTEVAEPVATVSAPTPNVAPVAAESSQESSPVKKAPRGKKGAKTAPAESGPREGSKTAQVVAMLQRKNGATLPEIMEKMGWQKHTVRGFMARVVKKAGYAVESFKSDKGERTYRINS
jgi:Protein of unknown function (DUF3489)